MDDVLMVKTLAGILAGRTGWAWKPGGPAYAPGEVGIFYGAIASSPDQAVGLTPYAIGDDIENGLATRRVQVRFRGTPGDPTGADRLAGEAFAAVQGLVRVAGLSEVSRVSSAQLGPDGNGRQERTDNYQIILDNPEAF